MREIVDHLKDDRDLQQLFFGTIFDKMYLKLSNIRVETLRIAESYIEMTKNMLEFKEA